MPQVDGDRAAIGGRARSQLGEGLGLERDHLGLVDLEDRHVGGPVQPVGAGIKTGGQNHCLADTDFGRLMEERVEETGPGGHRVGHLLEFPAGVVIVDVSGGQVSGGPSGEEIHADGLHEWLGELVVDQGVVGLGGDGSGRGNHRGCCSYAGREVPGVVIGARHACS